MNDKKTYVRPTADIINALENYRLLAGSVVTKISTQEATEEARGNISNVWETGDSPQKSLFDIEEE